MNEVRDVKEELLREFRDEVQRLMRGPMRQRDLSWQTAEERDHVLQLSDANVEPIGGRGSERPHRAIKEATVGLQILDSRKEDYGYDSHKLGTYTAPLLESEDSAHLPLQSMDPNIQQSPVVDRKQRKKKKKGKFNSCTESVDTGKGKKLALTPEKHVEEQHVEERKRKRKKSKKEGKRTKRLAKCPAGSIISIGSGNDSSPIGALPSSPVRELEVKDSPEKAARREAKRRRRAEVEEGSIELGMPARKKREKTRELTMSPQPGTEEDEAGRGRRRSKSLNRKSVSANEISDTPEKVAGSGAKRKMHPDTELEGSPCGGRQSKRSKRKDKAILTSSFEAQSPSPSPKARHTKDLSKVKAVVPSSSRADEAAGVAAAHDPLINQDVVMLEGRKLAGKAKKAKKKTQTAEEKDYNAHRAVAQAQERERAEKTKNASFAAPQPTAAPSSSKAGATTKPAPKSSPQIEAVVVPKPPRPPQPSQPQAPPPQPRHPKASLTAHIPTRPSLPAPIPQPVYDRNTLAARLAHDRATQPAAPAHYRSDIHPAGGLPAAMRRARCTNTNTAFPIVADCTCGGSVPTFFSPHQETPDIDKWPGSRDEFWRWVKMIAECKGHDPLAKGRCEVLYWVVGPGKVCRRGLLGLI